MRFVLCDDNRTLCEALGVALEARGHQVLATAPATLLGIAEARSTGRMRACSIFSGPPDGLAG